MRMSLAKPTATTAHGIHGCAGLSSDCESHLVDSAACTYTDVCYSIIAGALLIFFLFSCITARRRRRMGYQPYNGTGWALGRTPPGHGAAMYNGQHVAPQQESAQPYYNNSNNAPPAYTPPPNQGYYGNDVESGLQQPGAAYNGQYAPPKNPPPGRKDNIVR